MFMESFAGEWAIKDLKQTLNQIQEPKIPGKVKKGLSSGCSKCVKKTQRKLEVPYKEQPLKVDQEI